jgi:hypothetical protein
MQHHHMLQARVLLLWLVDIRRIAAEQEQPVPSHARVPDREVIPPPPRPPPQALCASLYTDAVCQANGYQALNSGATCGPLPNGPCSLETCCIPQGARMYEQFDEGCEA